jgi:hypothetical protein
MSRRWRLRKQLLLVASFTTPHSIVTTTSAESSPSSGGRKRTPRRVAKARGGTVQRDAASGTGGGGDHAGSGERRSPRDDTCRKQPRRNQAHVAQTVVDDKPALFPVPRDHRAAPSGIGRNGSPRRRAARTHLPRQQLQRLQD